VIISFLIQCGWDVSTYNIFSRLGKVIDSAFPMGLGELKNPKLHSKSLILITFQLSSHWNHPQWKSCEGMKYNLAGPNQ